MQSPDTSMGSKYTKMRLRQPQTHFGVFRAHGMCLVATKCRFHRRRSLQHSPNPLAGIWIKIVMAPAGMGKGALALWKCYVVDQPIIYASFSQFFASTSKSGRQLFRGECTAPDKILDTPTNLPPSPGKILRTPMTIVAKNVCCALTVAEHRYNLEPSSAWQVVQKMRRLSSYDDDDDDDDGDDDETILLLMSASKTL